MGKKAYEVAKISGHGYDAKGELKYKVEWKSYPSAAFTWQKPAHLEGAKEKMDEYEKKIGLAPTMSQAEKDKILQDKAIDVDLAAEEAGADLNIIRIEGHKVERDILYLDTIWSNGEIITMKKEGFSGPADMLQKYLQDHNLRVSIRGSHIITPARESTARSATTPATPKPIRANSPTPAPATPSTSARASPPRPLTTMRARRASSIPTPNTSTRRRAAAPKTSTPDVPKSQKTIKKDKPATGVIKVAPKGRTPRGTPVAATAAAASPASPVAKTARSRAAAGANAIPKNVLSFETNPAGDRVVVVSAGDGSTVQIVSADDFRRVHPEEYMKKLEDKVFGGL